MKVKLINIEVKLYNFISNLLIIIPDETICLPVCITDTAIIFFIMIKSHNFSFYVCDIPIL